MSGSGQVCRFFLEGRCKFGAQCKFRHPSGGAGGGGGGSGGWYSRGGGGIGGRHQGDPVDSGRRWEQRGGNRFQLFSDNSGGGGGGGSYNSGRGWDNRGQSQWRGGGRGGARGGGRGGGWAGGGTRQSSNYQNQRYQNDQYYQSDRYSGDRFQQNWSTRGRGFYSNSNQRSSNYQNSYQRIGRYGPASTSYDNHQQQASELSDPGEIAAQIRLDMEEWNKSSMWPLSCYAYFRETPCLPGFADVSPEELRWEAYRAKASGNSEHYLKNVSQLNDERLKLMHEFSNLTKDDVRDMLSGLKTGASGVNSSSQSLFAPSPTGTTTSSLFGNSTPSSSLFGSQRQSSLFASSPPPTTMSTAQQQDIQTTTGSLFGAQDMLTKQMSTTVAGQQQINQAQTTQPSQSQSTTLAGNSGVVAGGSTKLTDKELEAFKADKFILGQIPEHPPPEVLCN